MKDEDTTEILRRLGNLETHIINLIIPIQGINEVFKDTTNLNYLIDNLKKPLKVDDRNLAELLREFRLNMREFQESIREFAKELQTLDLTQTFGEIKFIGKRLNEMESTLKEIKQNGLTKNIQLDFTVDGYQMVKKPTDYDPTDPVEDPNENLDKILNTLTSGEAQAIIHRLGLFGQKKKTYDQIGKILGVTRERARQIFAKVIQKFKYPKRKELMKKVTHPELRKLVFG